MTIVRKVVLPALIAVMVAGGAAALFAQAAPGGRPGRPGGPGGRGFAAGFALGQLDLSEAQKQQVRDISQRHRQQAQPLMQRLQEAMEAQRVAVTTVPVNEDLVRTAAQQLAVVQSDMAVEQARLHSDIFAVLTVEQQEKAKELQSRAQARAKERRERAAQRQPRRQI